MNDLLKRLAKARERHTEEKITLRNFEYDLESAENALAANTDYKALGSNNGLRDIALEEMMASDTTIAALRASKRDAEDRVDRAELVLEQALDERRYEENVVWARAVDALRGRVDHPGRGVAPQRAAEEAVKEAIEETAAERLARQNDEYVSTYDNLGVDEIPF